MKPLKKSFYLREDVLRIARDLLGKYLITSFEGKLTGGVIIETEAYEGITDRASHAFGGRMTNRTQIMFEEGGISYVYLCYGIHSLFNVVTNVKGIPHAVLIRAVMPEIGIETISQRTGKDLKNNQLHKYCDGPGKVTKALGIHYSHSGLLLNGPDIWIEDRGISYDNSQIIVSERIGVGYAGEDASLPYRFYVKPFYLINQY